MTFFKVKKENGTCIAINRDKIISIQVFLNEKKNNIKLFIEKEKENLFKQSKFF
jgi:hypothetical protein